MGRVGVERYGVDYCGYAYCTSSIGSRDMVL